MEQFAAYLLRSALWLSVFALVWVVFLRNERYFTLKRFYLLSGILASFLLPLVTFRYNVEVPVPASQLMVMSEQAVPATAAETDPLATLLRMLFLAYLAGAVFIICRMAFQIIPLLAHAEKQSKRNEGRANIITSTKASPSFSFFNYVFINPNVDEDQRRDILNHEMAHVRQKHWIDLIIAELLCTIQWINPLAWIWARIIRQNHEYLADSSALQSSTNPAVYRATLLNHILDSRVFTLSNSFNQSINKKRFDMMKQKISSPYRKMRVLFVLPVMALLMYAFAEPAYHYVASGENSRQGPEEQQQSEKMVRGRVLGSEGPLAGAMVIVTGTATGTVTDKEGNYMIRIPDGPEASLTFAAEGYKRYDINQYFTPFDPSDPNLMVIDISLVKETQDGQQSATSSQLAIRTNEIDDSTLIVVDGVKISNIDMHKLNPSDIESVTVITSEEAVRSYAEEGITRVILITTKKSE